MTSKLDHRLQAIGIRLMVARRSGESPEWIDIEMTLLEALTRASSDYRLASLLFTWVKVHGNYVIVEKLRKLARNASDPTTTWLTALAAFAVKNKYHKWAKLIVPAREPVHLLPREITEIPMRLRGAYDWLEAVGILLPLETLRIREEDVLSPPDLARRNRQYRNRYLYGPAWRADIITAIEEGCRSPMEIVHRIGCSYEPAHRVFHEYQIVVESKTACDPLISG